MKDKELNRRPLEVESKNFKEKSTPTINPLVMDVLNMFGCIDLFFISYKDNIRLRYIK